MPCNPKKDLSRCVAHTKIRLLGGGYFFSVYLWADKKSFLEQFFYDKPGSDADAGCCPFGMRGTIPACNWWRRLLLPFLSGRIAMMLFGVRWVATPKAGELHFVSPDWNLEEVAHECLHATLYIAHAYNMNPKFLVDGSQSLSPHLADTPVAKECGSTFCDEELVCYIHGQLVKDVYAWLWRVDCPDGWEKEDGGVIQ